MRLAAQAKGGYYPTPERVVDLVAGLIEAPAGSYYRNTETRRVLDPCCGAGDAAAQQAEGLRRPNTLPVETYGVELHRDRAEAAQEALDRALAADLFQTSIANGAFGIAYVNPPYDWDREDKRVEHAFLTQCTRYLAEGGLLVFIVPRPRLAVSARYLSSHYWDLRCWAFPHPEREAFDQVVLMGRRRAELRQDEYAEQQVRDWSQGEPETLAPHNYPVFSPPTATPGDILFTTRTVDPLVAVAEAKKAGLWVSREVRDSLWPATDQRARPLMPLRRGHLSMLGGGGLPGQPGPGGQRPAGAGQGPHHERDGAGGGDRGNRGVPGTAQDHRGRLGPGHRRNHGHRCLASRRQST